MPFQWALLPKLKTTRNLPKSSARDGLQIIVILQQHSVCATGSVANVIEHNRGSWKDRCSIIAVQNGQQSFSTSRSYTDRSANPPTPLD